MIESKPKNPTHPFVGRVLHKVLPAKTYRRYVGRHEDMSLAMWKRLAESVPAESAILDIGAFHGEFSLLARVANAKAKVFGFEPNPLNLTELRAACGPHNIEIVGAAVAEKPGFVRFVCESAHSRIAEAGTTASRPGVNEEDVPAVALDPWCAERSLKVSLIKIDVEGAESAILRGATRVLRDFKPIILCEVLSDAAGVEVMRVLPAEYTYWHIEENKGFTQKTEITRKKWRNRNWLLVPKAALNSIRSSALPILSGT